MMGHIFVVDGDKIESSLLQELLDAGLVKVDAGRDSDCAYHDIFFMDYDLPAPPGPSPSEHSVNDQEAAAGELRKALQAYKAGVKGQEAVHVALRSLLQGDQVEVKPVSEDAPSRDLYYFGLSDLAQTLYKSLSQAAQTKDSVFLRGEFGTGRILCARMIHRLSDQPADAFLHLNASLMSDDEIQQALSHAVSSHASGTIYVSEILDLSLQAQALLMRLLACEACQSKLIASSSCCLRTVVDHNACDYCPADMASSSPCSKKVVDKHGFREDLYYAMNAVSIPIASLRERSADIPHLANIYLRRHARAFGKEFFGFDPAALEAFKNYPWPGNMLELENTIKSIIALNDGAQFVKLSMLPEWLVRRSDTSDAVPIMAEDDVAEAGHNRIIPIRDLERQAIKRALQLCDGNIQEAALRLKISPATLYRKRPQEESYS